MKDRKSTSDLAMARYVSTISTAASFQGFLAQKLKIF
jgi:hypothetical protein